MDKSLVIAGPTGDGRAPLQAAGAPQTVRPGTSGGERGGRGSSGAGTLSSSSLLREEAEPKLRGPEQAAWFERLDAENGNLRAALMWLMGQGEGELALRLSGALGDFWHVRGHLDEGRRWLEAALASEDAAPARIKALLHAGWLAGE